MIDWLELRIPFKPDSYNGFVSLIKYQLSEEIRLCSSDILCGNEIGSFLPQNLIHNFESVKSSFSGLAFKINPDGLGEYKEPHIILKGSPAKILQGHNIYGSLDFDLCFFEFMYVLNSRYPKIFEDLDINCTELREIDITFSAKLDNDQTATTVLESIGNIQANQTKATGVYRGTSVYFSPQSTYVRNKVYLKNPEVLHQIAEAERALKKRPVEHEKNRLNKLIKSMKENIEFTKGLLRFESRFKARKLEKLGIPTQVVKFKKYALQQHKTFENLFELLWGEQWNPILKKYEGKTVNINNDTEITNLIKTKYIKFKTVNTYSTSVPDLVVKSKRVPVLTKVNRLTTFYQLLTLKGYKDLKQTYPRTSFWRNSKDLVEAGIPEYQLHNMSANMKNVVPLVRLINVDFAKQRPVDYIEPKSQYPLLRAV